MLRNPLFPSRADASVRPCLIMLMIPYGGISLPLGLHTEESTLSFTSRRVRPPVLNYTYDPIRRNQLTPRTPYGGILLGFPPYGGRSPAIRRQGLHQGFPPYGGRIQLMQPRYSLPKTPAMRRQEPCHTEAVTAPGNPAIRRPDPQM